MPQATQAPTDHSFQTLQSWTLATHKAWAGDMGGWGLGVSGSPQSPSGILILVITPWWVVLWTQGLIGWLQMEGQELS